MCDNVSDCVDHSTDATDWDLVLPPSEIFCQYDTKRHKIGDGKTRLGELPWAYWPAVMQAMQALDPDWIDPAPGGPIAIGPHPLRLPKSVNS